MRPTLIDPDRIPGAGLDPDGIDAAARHITSIGHGTTTQGQSLLTAWRGIGRHYDAPEATALVDVMDPVGPQTRKVGADLVALARALTVFADDVRPVAGKLAVLKVQADLFATTARRGVVLPLDPDDLTTVTLDGRVDWDQDPASVDKNNALITAVGDQVELLALAERRCANTIYDLTGHAHLVAGDAPGATAANAYGLNDIPAGPTPWGSTGDRRPRALEGIKNAATGFFTDGILSFGAAAGFARSSTDPDGWTWSFGNAVRTQRDTSVGTGRLAVGLAALSVDGPVVKPSDNRFGQWLGTQEQFVLDSAGSTIEGVKENPWGAGTTAALTAGSLAVPGVGEAKLGEMAGRGARLAGDLARRSGRAGRLGTDALKASRAAAVSRQALDAAVRTALMTPEELNVALAALLRRHVSLDPALATAGPKDSGRLHMAGKSGGNGSSSGGRGHGGSDDEKAELLAQLHPRRDEYARSKVPYRLEISTQKGRMERETGARVLPPEKDGSKLWLERGYDVLHLRDGLVHNERTPDYWIKGVGGCDIWSPAVLPDSTKIKHYICGKHDQTNFIQVEINQSDRSIRELNQAVDRVFGSPDGAEVMHVMFSHRGEIILDRFRVPSNGGPK